MPWWVHWPRDLILAIFVLRCLFPRTDHHRLVFSGWNLSWNGLLRLAQLFHSLFRGPLSFLGFLDFLDLHFFSELVDHLFDSYAFLGCTGLNSVWHLLAFLLLFFLESELVLKLLLTFLPKAMFMKGLPLVEHLLIHHHLVIHLLEPIEEHRMLWLLATDGWIHVMSLLPELVILPLVHLVQIEL